MSWRAQSLVQVTIMGAQTTVLKGCFSGPSHLDNSISEFPSTNPCRLLQIPVKLCWAEGELMMVAMTYLVLLRLNFRQLLLLRQFYHINQVKNTLLLDLSRFSGVQGKPRAASFKVHKGGKWEQAREGSWHFHPLFTPTWGPTLLWGQNGQMAVPWEAGCDDALKIPRPRHGVQGERVRSMVVPSGSGI